MHGRWDQCPGLRIHVGNNGALNGRCNSEAEPRANEKSHSRLKKYSQQHWGRGGWEQEGQSLREEMEGEVGDKNGNKH